LKVNKTGFFQVFMMCAPTPAHPLAHCGKICGHSKIRVAIGKCTFSAVTEQLISKVRNLLFSFFLGKKGKIFENSKFRTLLISCSVTAENVHFPIATRILLCPPFSAQNFRSALGVSARSPKKLSALVSVVSPEYGAGVANFFQRASQRHVAEWQCAVAKLWR
jgi:hypothetical protein